MSNPSVPPQEVRGARHDALVNEDGWDAAEFVTFDNSVTGLLTADQVQAAIDELSTGISGPAGPPLPGDKALGALVQIGVSSGDGHLVQWDSTTSSGSGISLAYPGDTTLGNMLVAVIVDRGGPSGSSPSTPSGWTAINEGGKWAHENAMFARNAPGGPVTVAFNPPTNECRLYIMEFEGAIAGLLDTTEETAHSTSSTYTLPDVTVATAAVLVGSVDAGDGPPNPVTFTEDAAFTNIDQGHVGSGLNPESNVGYRVVAAGTYGYAPTGNHSTVYGGILAAFGIDSGWVDAGFEATDGDDATYLTVVGGNVLRVNTGTADEIARIRLRIATATAGARSYLLEGANASDFSDAVSVATLAFTAIGSYTEQTVEESWTPTDSYRYWQLTGDNETRRIHEFELYEGDALIFAVQAELDDHLADATDAHDASAVSIVDAGGYFTGTQVEAALQELGAAGSGTGLPWFNVMDPAYGATNDGSTDDLTAINDAIAAWNSAGSGVLYFPAGTGYKVTGALTTITASGTVMGDGMGAYDSTHSTVFETSSVINCTSGTAVLFTVTGGITFRDISLVKTGAAASAGSAIKVSGTIYRQHVTMDRVFIEGFYDAVDVQTNSIFTATACSLSDPSHYGFKIQNTVEPDAGGASIIGCAIVSETQGATAGIFIASSGGNKIIGCNINNIGTYGIQMTAAASSSILIVSGCSIENYTGDGIHLDGNGQLYRYIVVSSSEFGQYGNSTGHAFYSTGINDIIVTDCTLVADTGTPTAVSLNSGTRAVVGPFTNLGFGTLLASSSYTSIDDRTTVTNLSAIDFLVGTASGLLSGEIAVGTTPGGELGGTWASPTVDATHAGSTHIPLSSATPLVESGAGSAGSGTAASKNDHVHPAASVNGGLGPLLLASDHATPIVFDDILQASDGSDFLYASTP